MPNITIAWSLINKNFKIKVKKKKISILAGVVGQSVVVIAALAAILVSEIIKSVTFFLQFG